MDLNSTEDLPPTLSNINTTTLPSHPTMTVAEDGHSVPLENIITTDVTTTIDTPVEENPITHVSFILRCLRCIGAFFATWVLVFAMVVLLIALTAGIFYAFGLVFWLGFTSTTYLLSHCPLRLNDDLIDIVSFIVAICLSVGFIAGVIAGCGELAPENKSSTTNIYCTLSESDLAERNKAK